MSPRSRPPASRRASRSRRCRAQQMPSDEQLAETEIAARLGRAGRRAAAHAKAALGAGTDGRRGGLAGAAGPAGRPAAHQRAWHARRFHAGKHPRCALPPDQALCRGRRGAEGKPLGAACAGLAERQDAGHPRPRRHRPGAGEARDHAADGGASARAAIRRRSRACRRCCRRSARTTSWRAPTSWSCCCPSTPETENFHQRRIVSRR
jgi:hypothetical protein